MNENLVSQDLTWMALKGMRTVDLVKLRQHRQKKLAKQRLRLVSLGLATDNQAISQKNFINYKISDHEDMLKALEELAMQELQYIDLVEQTVGLKPNQTSSQDIVDHLWNDFEIRLLIIPKENRDESV